MRSKDSPALAGQYLVGMLLQPGILSMQEHFVASGRQVIPLTGFEDRKPGDLVGVALAPLLRVPLDALQHHTHTGEPYPGQTADYQVSAVTSLLDTGETASAVTPTSPALLERFTQTSVLLSCASGTDYRCPEPKESRTWSTRAIGSWLSLLI